MKRDEIIKNSEDFKSEADAVGCLVVAAILVFVAVLSLVFGL